MKIKRDKITGLISSIDELIKTATSFEDRYARQLADVHPEFKRSARNLVHYRAIRTIDLSAIQNRLGNLGISRLAQAHGHIMASLISSKRLLWSLLGEPSDPDPAVPLSVRKSHKLLRTNTKSLLGYRSKGRRTRIMVTLPSDAATDYQLVHDMVDAGMNSARINCAHDNRDVWGAMIRNVRLAGTTLHRNVRVCMDLAGPKIRTGPMSSGASVLSFQPDRDNLGRVSGPGVVWLGPVDGAPPPDAAEILSVSPKWLSKVAVGNLIYFHDTREKERYIEVVEEFSGGWWCHAFDRAFVVTGTKLFLNDWSGDSTEILGIPPTVEKIVLRVGDRLILHAENTPGGPAERDESGRVVQPAHISCTNPEVFQDVEVGHRVRFDDGKIEGEVVELNPGRDLTVNVTYARAEGQKLAADKGINFPDSSLAISGLTSKDRDDLEFIVENADVVNMSFVNKPSDVDDLLYELERHDALGKTGIILKIETRSAFDNMTEILLTAMKAHPVGVMIARGDLAVECGWENMARIQHEIQALCRAAHLPDVWATQVLETMAKKGLPSRAELTDAATALGAECVMLNKGPYIIEALKMLDKILKDMRAYQHDKAPMLPALAPS